WLVQRHAGAEVAERVAARLEYRRSDDIVQTHR
nr:DJ-1/PfpI family protein [Euzebyaceae bacterium]